MKSTLDNRVDRDRRRVRGERTVPYVQTGVDKSVHEERVHDAIALKKKRKELAATFAGVKSVMTPDGPGRIIDPASNHCFSVRLTPSRLVRVYPPDMHTKA